MEVILPSKPDVSVVDSIAASSTYENDGPVEVMNNVGEGATVKIKNGGIKINGDVEDGAKIEAWAKGGVLRLVKKFLSAGPGGSNGIETEGRTGNDVTLVSDHNIRINNAGDDLKVKAELTVEAGNLGRNAHVEAGHNIDVGDVGDNSRLSSGHNLNAATIGKQSSVTTGHSLQATSVDEDCSINSGHTINVGTAHASASLMAGHRKSVGRYVGQQPSS